MAVIEGICQVATAETAMQQAESFNKLLHHQSESFTHYGHGHGHGHGHDNLSGTATVIFLSSWSFHQKPQAMAKTRTAGRIPI
jgi:hypothetical protein